MERPRRGINLEKQVWRLCLKYTTTLKKCGYEKFVETKPELAIKHVFKRICDKQLKSRMSMILKLRKEEFKKDFHKFVRQLAEEARAIDLQESARRYSGYAEEEDTDEEITSSRRHHKDKSTGRRGDPKKKGKKHSENSDEEKGSGKSNSDKGKDRKRRLPNCLNSKCDGQHFLKDCPNTPEEEKKKLKEAYHEAKRQKKPHGRDGKVGKISSENFDDHTSLFSASFYDGSVEAVAMADQGADANVIPPAVLGDLLEAEPELQVTTLKKARVFSNALKSATPIRCSKVVQATVRLRVRHGSALSLANIKWFVSDEELDCIYIGRHVLAAIGLDNRKLLAMACDRSNGYIDIEQAMREAGTPNEACADVPAGSICSLLQPGPHEYGSTFHSKGEDGSDCLENTDVYINLGEDTPEELDAALLAQVEKARSNGLGEEGCVRLTSLLERYRSIFGCGWANPNQPLSIQ